MFKILSLDGGGIRGAFTAAVLAEFERRLERPIGDYFDLVAGTSTGGLIAAAVASGVPAQQIVDFYKQEGPSVFTRRAPYRPQKRSRRFAMPAARRLARKLTGIALDDVLQSKYRSELLASAMTAVFGAALVGDVRKCRLVIPAVDLTVGRTVVFKTPHLPNLTRDRHYCLVDVLLATTAAPTYFPHAELPGGGAAVDGGLWANNPSLVAYTEAMKIHECAKRECDPSFHASEIEILSIGTGNPRYSLRPPGDNAGIGWWGPRVFDVASISQAQGVSFQLLYLLGKRYRRVDFELPDASWTLDSVEHLASLVHQGKTAAHEQLTTLMDRFFSTESPDYVPFEDCAAPHSLASSDLAPV